MVDGLPLRWGFIFRSVRNYMSDWTEHWRSDDVYLWKNEPGYVSTEFTYASPHFNGARDMYDLADRATALKAVLDGALMLGVGYLQIGRASCRKECVSTLRSRGSPNK